MLAGNEGRLVRRVTSFYDGDRFERDLVSISGVTTYVERIPATDQRTMRAWVLQLDRYVDAFTPPYYTALAGVNDEDGEELRSARAQAAELRDESRRADEQRESEELDRLAAEARSRRLSAERAQGRAEPPHSNAQEPERAYGGSYSRVDTGAGRADAAREQGAPRVDGAAREDDAYVRPSERSRYGARSQTGREYDGDATRRLTYDSPRSNYGRDGEYAAERAQSQPAQPVQPASPRRRPLPKPIEAVVNSLGLDGVLLNAGLVDGSFLRYVLERRIIFAAWRRGWINKRTRAYVADASVSQATMAELQLAGVKTDALRTRDSASAARRAQKIEQANVLFESVDGLLEDARAQGTRLNLSGKLLICDTIRAEQIEPLRALGLSRVAVFTPMPEETYVSTAELEAMLSFIFGREPRYLHITDWEKLLDDAQLRQEMFPLR